MTINYEVILDCIDDGIFISNSEGIILMVNKSAEHTGGKSRQELIGKDIEELVAEGYCTEFVTKKVIESKEKQTIMQKTKDGREFLVTGIPYFEDGKLSMVVACERDITELKEMQNRLNESEKLKNQYENELILLKERLFEDTDIVFSSEKMTKVLLMAQKLANTDSTVLIQGESGTGKELIAKYIYENSKRKGKPFLKVNCGAIPEMLIESEMFGYEPGAFTGALKTGKLGYFELADGGTLFLDEINELSLNLQVKLLRAIQERRIMRIGGTHEIEVDIRIISATNQKLKNQVSEGKFRQDLYYRLNVANINLPPLRERKEDIAVLSKCFLNKFNKKYDFNKSLSLKAMRYMESYEWPGNVRELEHFIESLVITAEEDSITLQDVKSYFDDESLKTIALNLEMGSIEEKVNAFEKAILVETFERFHDTALMAIQLKTTRSTINRKLKKYQIR